MPLIRTPNIDLVDTFYKELIDSQRDMNEEQAQMMNAKLVLILANHVGDRSALSEAIELASGSQLAGQQASPSS